MDEERYDDLVYALFAPRSINSLIVDYPELRDYEEFKIKKHDLLFVWYYACKVSPLYDHTDVKSKREKIERCIKASGLMVSSDSKSRFLEGNFSSKISAAINKMESFEPAVRIMMKLDSVQKFMTLKKLTSLKLDDDGNHESFKNKDGEINFTAKKQYMEMILKLEEKKPQVIEQIENGFGITGIKKGSNDKNYDDNGMTMLESYWSQQ